MTEPTKAVRLPEMIPLAAGAMPTTCEFCGGAMYWTRHRGTRVPVACPASITTKTAGVLVLPCVVPTPNRGGMGINHHIDCPRKEMAAKIKAELRPPPDPDVDELRAKIAAAEALAERHGLRCTGAADAALGDVCGGFAVIAYTLSDRLFATPCSYHADSVQRALNLDRRKDAKVHVLAGYLRDDKPERSRMFVDRAAAIRARNSARGFRVPKQGPLV